MDLPPLPAGINWATPRHDVWTEHPFEVAIATPDTDGVAVQTVDGWTRRGFGVAETYRVNDVSLWCVTHLATGLAVPGTARPTYQQAMGCGDVVIDIIPDTADLAALEAIEGAAYHVAVLLAREGLR